MMRHDYADQRLSHMRFTKPICLAQQPCNKGTIAMNRLQRETIATGEYSHTARADQALIQR